MALIQPQLVGIDSSIFSKWSKETYSTNKETQKNARDSLKKLFESNWIPTLSWHHFQELIRHQDEQEVKNRIAFLSSFPYITWIRSSKDQAHLGTIVDLFNAEVRVAISFGENDFKCSFDDIRSEIISYGSPSEIKSLNMWHEYRPIVNLMMEREQEIASIVHSNLYTDPRARVFQLKEVPFKDDLVIEQTIYQEASRLAGEISKTGDQRVNDPTSVAEEFMNTVAKASIEMANSGYVSLAVVKYP